MLDFSRPAAFAGAGQSKAPPPRNNTPPPAAPAKRRQQDDDDDDDDDNSPRAQAPSSSSSSAFRPAPTAMAPRPVVGPYATFLQSSNILGIAQPVAVPPPSVSAQQKKEDEEKKQQQEQASSSKAAQQSQKDKKSSAFSQDASSGGLGGGGANKVDISNEDRSKLSRDALQRQLECYGITEAVDPTSGAAAYSGAAAAADPLKGMTHAARINYIPRSLLQCKMSRVKGGLFDGNVYFSLEAEMGKHFFVTGRKRTRATSNFLISSDWDDMHRNSDTFIGKVRGNESKTVYAIYDNGESPETILEMRKNNVQAAVGRPGAVANELPQLRTELAYVLYQTNFGGSSGPRKMIVVVPKKDPVTGQPLRVYQPKHPEETMFEAWKADPAQFWTLETKQGTWNEALRSYQLNFHGRVKCQSVKNFQLVEASQPGRVVMQFGKRAEDDFICDYQAPLNAFLAFAVGMTAFDGNFVRE